MSNLAIRQNTELAQAPAWESKLDLVKRTCADGATDEEFELFLHQARRTGLDPLARQIYCIVRGKGDRAKATIMVGIDGFRLIAARTGDYAGNAEPRFDGWVQSQWKSYDQGGTFGHPESATVVIRKLVRGIICEFSATAYFDEYYPGDAQGSMYRKMPRGQLAKCAEALAFRKAFPNDLSHIYVDAEMERAVAEDAPLPRVLEAEPPRPANSVVPDNVQEKAKILKSWGMSPKEMKELTDAIKAKDLNVTDSIIAARDAGATCASGFYNWLEEIHAGTEATEEFDIFDDGAVTGEVI